MSDAESSRRGRVEWFLSIAVGLAAIAAAVASLYQANLARAQLRASAWPFVQHANGGGGRERPYVRVVSNEGIGPARIRSQRVLVDMRPVATWNEAVRALTGEGEPALTYSSFGRGTVLPAGTSRTLLTLPPGPRAVKFWLGAQHRLRTVTCYCSVYDECWSADSEVEEPTPVKACTAEESSEFRQ